MPPAQSAATQCLRSRLTNTLLKNPATYNQRGHIVSPSLCDHVIQRLAPSLAQHVGCTIIDINPGIGLWSSKLHDYLKPRSHVLMEPKQDVFLPYLRPLLDAPSSRYVLRDWPALDQWQPQKYVQEGLLPPPDDGDEHKHKRSPILIIANLTDHAAKRRKDYESGVMAMGDTLRSHVIAIDLAHAVRMKSMFQAWGPTRVLMWMPDSEKRAIVPRTVGYRSKVAAYLEPTFHVEEVAGAVPTDRARREDRLDVESSKLVAKRMEEDGIQIPSERQEKATNMPLVSSKARAWHAELQELEEGFKSLKLSQFVGKPPGPLLPHRNGRHRHGQTEWTPEYKKYDSLRKILKSQNKKIDKLNQILQKQEEIDRLDLAAHRKGISSADREREFKAIDAKVRDYKDELESLNSKDLEAIAFLDDDRRAFSQTPPLLSWDRRRAEPLLVQPNEFYPNRELALVDFQPLPEAQQFPLTHEQSIYYDTICTALFASRGGRTLKHLNHIAPGAYDALVPKCPTITDPRKGGRRDVESVTVRTLTSEMLWQLTKAWDEWLFKPELSELLTRFRADYRAVEGRGRSVLGV